MEPRWPRTARTHIETGQRLREHNSTIHLISQNVLCTLWQAEIAQLTHGHLDVPDPVLLDVDELRAGGVLALGDAEAAVVCLGVEEALQFAREVGDVGLLEGPDQVVLAGVLRREGCETRQLLICEIALLLYANNTCIFRKLTAQLLIFDGRLRNHGILKRN